MKAVLWLIDTLIDIYIWLLIAQAILSWLLAFGIVNRYNRGVAVNQRFSLPGHRAGAATGPRRRTGATASPHIVDRCQMQYYYIDNLCLL